MSLASIPKEERPREKLKIHGAQHLSDSELLAILLRTGSKGQSVLTLSADILQKTNLKKLSRIHVSRLQKYLGIGEAKACQVAACFELGRRLQKYKNTKSTTIRNPRDVAKLCIPQMCALNQEHLNVLFLNTRKKVIHTETVFTGTLNESVIHPREIFQRALEENAAAVILVHNHPSGDPTPSVADIQATKHIVEAGRAMDIPVVDHIIIGDNKHLSMKERGVL